MTIAVAASVRELYDRESQRLHHQADKAQLLAVASLDELRTRLLQPGRRAGILSGLISRKPRHVPEKGLYLWGGVGRGKTFLMDLFYLSLPFKNKQRSHFHRFMHALHDSLKKLTAQSDPLAIVADRLAAKSRVICFDEFYVADIADAMLLGTLFTHLFARGVTLVATSNVPPNLLYKDGLQRARFLPAIAQIEQHMEVLTLDGDVDYRLRLLERASSWFDASRADTQQELIELFEGYAGEPGLADVSFVLNHRKVIAERRAADIIWFSFKQLCDGPRGQADYIELARCYHTVIVSDIPLLDTFHENQARRFISLVDEFYDRGVKLIISAHAPLSEIYQGAAFKFEFERTQSRLTEMQSKAYLALAHRA